MPKIVDHEVRRAELSAALWRVLAREGVEGVSVRSVAAESGWTRGTVEHYFASKQAMLAYACRLAAERALDQIKERRRRLAGREALRAVLLRGFALSGERSEATAVWLSLLSAASRDQALAAELVRFDAEARVVLGEIITEMIERGEAAPDCDPEAEAHAIFAFNLGIGIGVRMQPEHFTADVVAGEIEGLLERLARGPQRER